MDIGKSKMLWLFFFFCKFYFVCYSIKQTRLLIFKSTISVLCFDKITQDAGSIKTDYNLT